MKTWLVFPLATVLSVGALVGVVVLAVSASGGPAKDHGPVMQARPTASASPAPILYRACDTVYKKPPSTSAVEARGPHMWVMSQRPYRPDLARLYFASQDQSLVAVDVTTGKVISEDYVLPADRTAMQPYVASVHLQPFDAAAAPWPYTDAVTTSQAEESHQDFTWRVPDPMSGLEATVSLGDGIGMSSVSLWLANCRSRASWSIVSEVGKGATKLPVDYSYVNPEDLPAFHRFFAAAQMW